MAAQPQTNVKPDQIPPELDGIKLLKFFGTAKYIILLYDNLGNPVWAAERSNHKYKEFIDALFEGTLSQYYDVPECSDLNDLFQQLAGTRYYTGLLEQGDMNSISQKRLPCFLTKNILEPLHLFPNFLIQYPLTRIYLAKVSRERFLGIICFPDIAAKLSEAEYKMSILADEKNNIIGFNSLFLRPLNARDPKGLLGRNIFDVMEFNRNPLDAPKDLQQPELYDFEAWQAGSGDKPFYVPDQNPGYTQDTEAGLLFANDDPEKPGYLVFNKELPVDNHNFTIEIGFKPQTLHCPGVLFRGNDYTPSTRSPDLLGYALSFGKHALKFQFKKQFNPVYFFEAHRIAKETFHTLTIQKLYDQYFFFINNHCVGRWRESAPFIWPSRNRLYIWIRPQQRILLDRIRIRLSRDYSENKIPTKLPLTARFKAPGLDYQFNVTVKQDVIENDNYLLYQFEDVTSFTRNISLLRRERDKLTTLLKHEKIFLGQSQAIMNIRDELDTVAQSNLSVLIEGETGVGKEVLAYQIHKSSPRKDAPFVKIDCSAIPHELMESELFGHEKGSFTGAYASHAGRFEQAQGGTVFLDEIANLPLNVQAKLLNVLQDLKVQRVGGTHPVHLDVRLIAASNKPLKTLIGKREFRDDLYYRLNQYRFYLPPLRERNEDIPLLAEYFIKEANQAYHKQIKGLHVSALEKLYHEAWPGNIRELRNVIFRAVLFCQKDKLSEKDIVLEEPAISAGITGVLKKTGNRGGLRKKCVLSRKATVQALKESHGCVTTLMKQAGIS
ncbi:MAG: sigma-54 dependent transcriptional regulator, partial [Fibrobacterota bacterium]